ncbi:YlxR family protein [Actinomyces polynesiensis]|uniref:YlxR family protein n=1 Tax=Actinomyces polynesiensis TaxID=1325934 RepID=UPI0018CCFD19|nr:YlxR family protein [Actinomyces polynesiensis]
MGCGRRVARGDLVRIVAADGSATVDPRCDRPGRGAWIHPDPRCIERARSRKALTRALRIPHDVGERVWVELAGVAPLSATRTACRTTSDGSGLEADGHPMSTQR